MEFSSSSPNNNINNPSSSSFASYPSKNNNKKKANKAATGKLSIYAVLGLTTTLIIAYAPFLFAWLLAALSLLAGTTAAIAMYNKHMAMRTTKRYLPALPLPELWPQVLETRKIENNPPAPPIIAETPSIQSRLDKLFHLFFRDFIYNWYDDLTSDYTFVHKLDYNLRLILLELKKRGEKIDLPSLMVTRMVPILTTHLHEFRTAVTEVRLQFLQTKEDVDITASEEFDRLLAPKYQNGRLHPAVSRKGGSESEINYLRKIADLILPLIFPPAQYQSNILRVFIREVLVCKLLHPTLMMVSDVDYLNQQIDVLATKQLQEEGLVSKFRETLDTFFTGTVPTHMMDGFVAIGNIMPFMDDSSGGKSSGGVIQPRSYDDFLKTIQQSNTVIDAKRIRHQILAEIKKKELQIAGKSNNDYVNGVRVVELTRYINRLKIAKRRCEKRIIELGGDSKTLGNINEPQSLRALTLKQMKLINLSYVLNSNTALFYFMEYMERSKCTYKMQYIIMNQSFEKLMEANVATVKEDANKIYSLYLCKDAPYYIEVPEEIIERVQSYLEDENSEDIKCMLDAKDYVFQEIERVDLSGFVKSDLFLRYTSDPAAQSELQELTEKSKLNSAEMSDITPTEVLPLGHRRSTSMISDSGKSLLALGGNSQQQQPSLKRAFSNSSISQDGDYPSIPALNSRKSSTSPIAVPNSGDAIAAIAATPSPLLSPGESSVLSKHTELDESTAEYFYNDDDVVNSHTMDAAEAALRSMITASENAMESKATNPPPLVRTKSTNFSYDAVAEEPKKDDIATLLSSDELLTEHTREEELRENIDQINQKEALINSLIQKTKKKESKTDRYQLRILFKSKAKLLSEKRELLLELSKHETQDTKEVIAPGLTTIKISHSIIGYDDSQKQFTLYVIEVHRSDPDNPSGWVVPRRYREFYELHQKLRLKYPIVNDFELPSKNVINKIFKKSHLVEERRQALQSYLQTLLDNREICKSNELREFLSQRNVNPYFATAGVDEEHQEFADVTQLKESQSFLPSYVRNISSFSKQMAETVVRPFSEAIDDLFPHPPSQSSSASTSAPTVVKSGKQEMVEDEDVHLNPYDDTFYIDDDGDNTLKPEMFSSLSEPLCNMIIELFEMKNRSMFLRRQAVLIILQQILGGTIERKVTENINWLISEEWITYDLDKLIDTYWPDGTWAESWPPRTAEQMEATKKEAKKKLLKVLPDAFLSMIGNENARKGGARFFDALQSNILNKHLMFCFFDEIICVMFPEIKDMLPKRSALSSMSLGNLPLASQQEKDTGLNTNSASVATTITAATAVTSPASSS